MPTNYSENKVRVTRLLGGNGFIGKMDPKVNMQTNLGPILILGDRNGQVTVGRGSGSYQQKFYPHQLYITEAHATGVWSYPSGDGSTVFGHKSTWPNGLKVSDAVGSGTTYTGGDGLPHTIGK